MKSTPLTADAHTDRIAKFCGLKKGTNAWEILRREFVGAVALEHERTREFCGFPILPPEHCDPIVLGPGTDRMLLKLCLPRGLAHQWWAFPGAAERRCLWCGEPPQRDPVSQLCSGTPPFTSEVAAAMTLVAEVNKAPAGHPYFARLENTVVHVIQAVLWHGFAFTSGAPPQGGSQHGREMPHDGTPRGRSRHSQSERTNAVGFLQGITSRGE